MRTTAWRPYLWILGTHLVCAGYACDGERTAFLPFAADPACEDLSCPLAVDAETTVQVTHHGQIDEVAVVPPDLASVAFDPENARATIRPSREGLGTLVLRSGGAEVLMRPIETAKIATTTLRLSPLYPDSSQQLYVSAMLRVVAFHRDTKGRPVLGHGVEDWAIDGGSFRGAALSPLDQLEGDRYLLDPELTRDVIADGGPEIRVTARGATLVLRAMPAGSAATLALEGVDPGEELRFGARGELRLRLDVYDRDGSYIHGVPTSTGPELEVGDPEVLSAAAITGRRAVFLKARRAGTTTLAIRFDGQVVRYPVRVR
jgi:hypothetical protein